MSYDPNVPDQLKTIQTWFAAVITQPIDQKNRIAPITPDGNSIDKEALLYIKPSSTQKPARRIEIYNQQYWWRLLNTMQTTFTMATGMLGYRRFNDQIAVPYLQMFPSEHYSVSHIGDRLVDWMHTHYSGKDKEILIDAISIDYAMNLAFFEATLPSITEETDAEKAFSIIAKLQPHITLFKMPYELFQFRKEIQTKDPDYWSSHHFPNLEHALSKDNGHFPKLKRDRTYYFIVYRSRLHNVMWEEISRAEHALLSRFEKGSSIEKSCEWLSEKGHQYLNEAGPHIQEWIQGWIAKNYFFRLNH